MYRLIQPIGLENAIHQCIRITVNWKCHFKCNFCYVPQLLYARKKKYKQLPNKELKIEEYKNFLEKLLKYYQRKNIDLFLPLSFCAADPLKSIDLQVELLKLSRNLYSKIYKISKYEAEGKITPTIIVDIHSKKNLEKLNELCFKLKKEFKKMFIWLSSTIWIKNNQISDKEIKYHDIARKICHKYGIAYFSIMTPTIDEKEEKRTKYDYLNTAKICFDIIKKNRQPMATINIAVGLIDGYNNIYFDDLKRSLMKTFIEFYEAYLIILLEAWSRKLKKKNLFDELKNEKINFNQVSHYLVCEIGMISGLGKSFLFETAPFSIGFGCFSTTGCFNSIIGLEPSGYISACQFGHDELNTKALKLKDFEEEIINSPQRIRNIRLKLLYPLIKKYCEYRNIDCSKTICSSLLRGSCPVDLYFQNISYIEKAYSCVGLAEANDRMINLIKNKLRMNLYEFSQISYQIANEEFNSIFSPLLMRKRNQ